MHFCTPLEKNEIFFIVKTVPEYGFCIFKFSPVEAVFDIEVIICWYPLIDKGSYGEMVELEVVFIVDFKLSRPVAQLDQSG